MYTRVRQLGLQSIAYGLGAVSNQLAGLILIPIYSRYLTPHDYGIVQLLAITSAIGLAIAQLGLSNAIVKSALYDDQSDIRTLYNTSFYTLSGSAILILIIGGGLSVPLSQLLFGTLAYAHLVRLTFLAAALDTAFGVVAMARMRIEGRAVRYSILSFSAFGTKILLYILFIVVLHRGVTGLIEAGVLQSLFFSLVYLLHIKDQLSLCFSFSEWRNLLGFGLPVVPGVVASSILAVSDRYFLRFYASLDDVGIYSLGYNIAACISLVNVAFLTAWRPTLFSSARDHDAPQFFSRILTYYLFLGGWLALGISVLAHDTLRIFSTEAYYAASDIVPLLALSFVFYGTYYVTNIGPLLEKKTYYVSFMIGVAMLTQIGMNFLLIPKFGMMGASAATMVSYLGLAILSIAVSNKLYPMSYEVKRIALLGATGVSMYLVSRLIHVENVFLSFVLRSLVALAFPLVLGSIGFYQRDERHKIKELMITLWAHIQRRVWGKVIRPKC